MLCGVCDASLRPCRKEVGTMRLRGAICKQFVAVVATVNGRCYNHDESCKHRRRVTRSCAAGICGSAPCRKKLQHRLCFCDQCGELMVLQRRSVFPHREAHRAELRKVACCRPRASRSCEACYCKLFCKKSLGKEEDQWPGVLASNGQGGDRSSA